MPTMKDVAKLAGVSIATVSCALSGAKSVSPATLKKIQSAIGELHYIPNSSARNLKLSQNKEIGIILADISDSYQADLLKGISAEMQRNGFNINIAFSENISDQECRKIDDFIGKNVAGFIILTCQPENTGYFRSRFPDKNLPSVFIERMPLGINSNFVCFDGRFTVSGITERLIELGYAKLSLVMGSSKFSCENECLEGFLSVTKKHGVSVNPDHICQTKFSKEDAFKTTMFAYEDSFPDAIITTSTILAKGVLETAYIYNKTVSKDVVIVSLSEESWIHPDPSNGFISTSRSAVTQGISAANLLIRNINSPFLFEKQIITLQDRFKPGMEIRRPAQRAKSRPAPSLSSGEPCLDILLLNTNIANALRVLARNYTKETGVEVKISTKVSTDILHEIEAENARSECLHDIYAYDIPWLPYIGANKLIADISQFVESFLLNAGNVLPEYLKNCRYDHKYFGIPIVGGSQLLFYRKDLFEDPAFNAEFENKYRVSLRPPVTWTEFNGICEFFTQKFNPKSPIPYGVSIAMQSPEELITYIMPYLWSHGGEVFDENNVPRLNSSQNFRAIEIFLNTLKYTDGNGFHTSLDATASAFESGKAAMLLYFTENAASRNMADSLAGRIGYSFLPGKCSILPGWNLGISNFTDKKERIFDFFNWVCQQNINYYLTILDGQSTVSAPYENKELLRLYPWLSLAVDGLKFSRRRKAPYKPGGRVIPQNKIENLIIQVIYDICNTGVDIKTALETAQAKMTDLFNAYGY